MTNIIYSDLSFRLVIVDDNKEENLNNDDYYTEFKIKKSFLKKLLNNSSNSKNAFSDVMLTSREIQVLRYLSDGLNNNEIAQKLKVSVHTVKAHVLSIYYKLSVQGGIED